MPRRMPQGLPEFLRRKNKQAESHTTLQVSVSNADIQKEYFFASAEVVIDGVVYANQLRRVSELTTTLTSEADRATVDLQNVDSELGKEFLGLGDSLDGSLSKVGRLWVDLESMAQWHMVMLTGPLVGLQVNESIVRLKMVSEPYSQVSVGSSRRYANRCQWKFRETTTCGYAGSLLTCNLMIDHADGCQGRHGDPLKRAKFGGYPYLNSKNRLNIF